MVNGVGAWPPRADSEEARGRTLRPLTAARRMKRMRQASRLPGPPAPWPQSTLQTTLWPRGHTQAREGTDEASSARPSMWRKSSFQSRLDVANCRQSAGHPGVELWKTDVPKPSPQRDAPRAGSLQPEGRITDPETGGSAREAGSSLWKPWSLKSDERP